MARFLRNDNNGVLALVSEEHAVLFDTAKRADGDPIKLGARIFTFCHQDRIDKYPELKHIVTGNLELMKKLLAMNGNAWSDQRSFGWGGYVPFSNNIEWEKQNGQPTKAAQDELRWRTTTQDVVETFLS